MAGFGGFYEQEAGQGCGRKRQGDNFLRKLKKKEEGFNFFSKEKKTYVAKGRQVRQDKEKKKAFLKVL